MVKKLVGNRISRGWSIEENGKTYNVDWTEADFQILGDRGWQVYDEEGNDIFDEAKGQELKRFVSKRFFKNLAGVLPDEIPKALLRKKIKDVI